MVMQNNEKLVLASASPFRAQLLTSAGLQIETDPAHIDERAVEQPLIEAGLDGDDLAMMLAIAKAQDVSPRHPSKIVIGGDQTLTLNGEAFHKPADMQAARTHLLKLSGQTHQLNSAICLVRDGEVLWEHTGVAYMTMRALTPQFIGRHLSQVGDAALTSVGAYQVEGPGIQLFEKIEGDYFTILGMPMIPLLNALREMGAIDG
jgi:septum formation protein